MPCSSNDGRGYECSHDGSAVSAARGAELRAIRQADDLARMLCDLCKEVEVAGQEQLFTRRIKEWWEEHKRQDAASHPPRPVPAEQVPGVQQVLQLILNQASR